MNDDHNAIITAVRDAVGDALAADRDARDATPVGRLGRIMDALAAAGPDEVERHLRYAADAHGFTLAEKPAKRGK